MGALFSIILPTYNRAYVLWRAIQSVLTQTEVRTLSQDFLALRHFDIGGELLLLCAGARTIHQGKG